MQPSSSTEALRESDLDNASVGFTRHNVDGTWELQTQIREAWRSYIVDLLGRSEEFARNAAMRSISLARGVSIVNGCCNNGVDLRGLHAIDVGSGLGDVAIALAQAGAHVTAVEPCDAWREIAIRRSDQLGLDIRHVSADAHDLPFSSDSFDVLISLQVLEHVDCPGGAIAEMGRVLKTGGFFTISCENYLAFREQHYGVAWLPLLPKWIGSLYLKMRRRDPTFLRKHITYTTWPSLVCWFLSSGFYHDSWVDSLDRLRCSSLIRRERVVAHFAGMLGIDRAATLIVAKNLRCLFRPGFGISGFKRDTSME